MKTFFLATLALLVPFGSLFAQDNPPKSFRFIALGERPLWKDKLENGIRQGVKAPPGALPPSQLSIQAGEETLLPFRPTLRMMSKVLTVPGKTPKLVLKQGEVGAAQDWLSSPMPTSRLNLGILFRDPANMNWNSPKMMLLKDDISSFPAGKARFVNVSDVMAIVQIGDWSGATKPKISAIRPGTSFVRPLEVGDNQIRVGYLGANRQPVWIWSNQIPLLKNQRVQAFFYKAQGPRPRTPLLFHFAPEPLPRPAEG
jgi:hypothetical protein